MPINNNNDAAVEVDGVIEDITSPQPPTISDNWSTSLLNSTIGELPLEHNSSALIVHINTTCTHVQEANAQLLAKARITIPAVMNYLFFNTAQIAVIYFGRKVLSNKTKIGLHEGAEDLKARLIRFLMSEIWPPLLRTDVPDESLGDEVKEQSFLADSLQLHKEGVEQILQKYQLQNEQYANHRTDYNNDKDDTNFDKIGFNDTANSSEKRYATELAFKEEQQEINIKHVNNNELSIINTESDINHIKNNNYNDDNDDDKKLNSIVWELAQENRWFRRSLESNMQVLLYLKRGVQGTRYLKVILNNSTHRLHFDVVSNAEEHHRWELRQLYTRLLDNLETQKGIDSYESYIRDFYEACKMAAEHSTVLEYPLQDMVHLRIHNEVKYREGQVSTHVAHDLHHNNKTNSSVTSNKNTNKDIHIYKNDDDNNNDDDDITNNVSNLYNQTHHQQHEEKEQYKNVKEAKYRWMSKLRKPESATLDYKSYFSYTACELKDRCVKFMCGFLNSYHEGKLVIGVHELPRSLAEVDHQSPHAEENEDEIPHSSHNNTSERSKAERDKFTYNNTSSSNNDLGESSSAEDESNYNSLFDSSTSNKSRHAREPQEIHRHSYNEKDIHNRSEANNGDNNNGSSYSNHNHHTTTTTTTATSSSFAVNATTTKSVHVHNDYVDQYVLGAHITLEELDDVQEELSRQLLNCVPPVPPRCVRIDVFELHIPDNVWCAPSAIILYERQNTPCWRTGVVRQKSNLLLRVLFPLGLTLLPLQIPINELESILDVERTILEKISANNLSNPYKLAAYAIVSFTHPTNNYNDNDDDEQTTGKTHMQEANNTDNNKDYNVYHDNHADKIESSIDRQYQHEELVQMTPPWLALLKSVMKQHESHCVFVLTNKLRRPVFTYRAPMSIIEISVNLKRCEYAPLITYRGKFFADWPSIPIWDITTRSVRRIERNYALLLQGTPQYRKVLRHKHVDVASHVPSQNINVHVEDIINIHKFAAQEDVIFSPDVIPCRDERNTFSRNISTQQSSAFHNCSVQRQWWNTPQIVGRVLGFIYSREIFASVLQFRLIHPTCNRVFENVQGTHLVEMIHSTPVGAPFSAADTTYISRMQSAFITANVPVMPLLLCRVFEILGNFPSPYPYVAVPLSQQSFRVSSFLIPLFYRQHYFDGMMRLAVMLDLRDGLVKSVQLRDGNLILETIVGVGFEPLNKRQLNRLLNSSTKLPNYYEEEKSEHMKRNVMEPHDLKMNESKRESRENVNTVETLHNATIEPTNVEATTTNIHNTELVPTLNTASYNSNSKKTTSDNHVAQCISNTSTISNTAMANSIKHNFLSRHPNWRRNTLRQTPSVLSNSFISPLLSNTTRVTEREIEANIPLIHFNFLTRSALESESTHGLIKVSEDMSENNTQKRHINQNDQDNVKSSKNANNTTQKNVENNDDHADSTKHMNDINNHHYIHEQKMQMHSRNVHSNAINNNSSIHNNSTTTTTYTDNGNNSASECTNALLPKALPPWTLRHLLSWLNALLADEEHYYFFGYCERSIAFRVNDVHEMCAAHLDPSASVFVANKSVNFATSCEECLLHNKVK